MNNMDYDFTYSDATTTINAVNDSTTNAAAVGALTAGVFILWFLAIAATYVLTSIFMGKLFRKAGVPFWKAWVPIYSTLKFLQIGGQNPLFILFNLIPFVGSIVFYVFMCVAAHNIDKKLGKGDAFVLLYIFFNIIWLGINAFDKSTWNESEGSASKAFETKSVAKPAEA